MFSGGLWVRSRADASLPALRVQRPRTGQCGPVGAGPPLWPAQGARSQRLGCGRALSSVLRQLPGRPAEARGPPAGVLGAAARGHRAGTGWGRHKLYSAVARSHSAFLGHAAACFTVCGCSLLIGDTGPCLGAPRGLCLLSVGVADGHHPVSVPGKVLSVLFHRAGPPGGWLWPGKCEPQCAGPFWADGWTASTGPISSLCPGGWHWQVMAVPPAGEPAVKGPVVTTRGWRPEPVCTTTCHHVLYLRRAFSSLRRDEPLWTDTGGTCPHECFFIVTRSKGSAFYFVPSGCVQAGLFF